MNKNNNKLQNRKKVGNKEELLASVNRKMKLYEKAMAGDSDAIMEFMCESGMCTKDALSEYYKIKEEYGD